MTVSSTLTWDEDPPRRPALSDVTNGTKANRPGLVPNPVTQPTAEEDNQKSRQTAALGGIAPMAILYVTFPAGAPTIAAVKAMGTNVVIGDFTPVDNGAGDTTIHWTSSVLPPVWSAPTVSQADDTSIDRLRAFYTTVGSNQAVRVKSLLGAVATDAAFVLTIY